MAYPFKPIVDSVPVVAFKPIKVKTPWYKFWNYNSGTFGGLLFGTLAFSILALFIKLIILIYS